MPPKYPMFAVEYHREFRLTFLSASHSRHNYSFQFF